MELHPTPTPFSHVVTALETLWTIFSNLFPRAQYQVCTLYVAKKTQAMQVMEELVITYVLI